MADNIAFHNPKDFGTWDLSTSQKDKVILFSWDTPVIPESKVVVYSNTKVIKCYTVGDGLTISNGGLDIALTLQGADYSHKDTLLSAQANFFVEGDVEVTFKLRIVESKLLC